MVGGLAVIVSVSAFPSFQDSGLQSFVSWSLESEPARVRRDDGCNGDKKCEARAAKAALKAAKKAAKEAAVQAKADARQAAKEAKDQARAVKVAAKQAAKEAKTEAKENARQAKADAKAAKVAEKEAIRQAKKEAKEQAIQDKEEAKTSTRLRYKMLDQDDQCLKRAVQFMSVTDEAGSVSGSMIISKPEDTPNDAGWYILVDIPKRHAATSAASGSYSTGTYPAVTVSGFPSWCGVELGSGADDEDVKTFTAPLSIDFDGSKSASTWDYYYCYTPLAEDETGETC